MTAVTLVTGGGGLLRPPPPPRAPLRRPAGAPVVVVNPTLPVGPGDRGRSPPTQMMLDFCRGKRREYLDAELNLIDVRDVAEGMVRAMAVGRPGRRYLLGHENLTIRELFRRLAKLTGLPEPRWLVPYGVAFAA